MTIFKTPHLQDENTCTFKCKFCLTLECRLQSAFTSASPTNLQLLKSTDSKDRWWLPPAAAARIGMNFFNFPPEITQLAMNQEIHKKKVQHTDQIIVYFSKHFEEQNSM
jgi:hypothetical protein